MMLKPTLHESHPFYLCSGNSFEIKRLLIDIYKAKIQVCFVAQGARYGHFSHLTIPRSSISKDNMAISRLLSHKSKN